MASRGQGLPQGVWPAGGSLPGKFDKDTRSILQVESLEDTATWVSSYLPQYSKDVARILGNRS